MSENYLQVICSTISRISQCVQANLSKFISVSHKPHTPTTIHPISLSTPPKAVLWNPDDDSTVFQSTNTQIKKISAGPVTKEELGRATWTFLHTLGAQYPEKPTRQQKKDVKELMAILSRMYPCKECADHFKELLRSTPVQAGSQSEFSQWLCRVHNVVNRSLGKPAFPCERVDARWGKLDCKHHACDLQGSDSLFP